MAVGKPDFELNSFGIQYKEKRVNYTNKKNITVTTAAEEAREQAKWSKMNTPLEVQSNNSKKRGEPAPNPNAAQLVGSAPTETQPLTHMVEGKQVEKPKTSKYTRGYQQLESKDETQQATSSPPVEPNEDTSSSVDRIPHATRVRAGGIVDLHSGKGTQNSQARGNDLSTLVGQEGGSTHAGMDPSMNPSKQLSGGKGDKLAQAKVEESKKNPTLPKGYVPPKAKKTKKKSNEIILKMNIMKLDLMEIKKNKNWGDTSDPVTDEIDVEGNPIKVKPHPQKEVFTDINNNNAHQNPTPIDGGGFAGKWRRTGKKDKDGNPIKYQQSKDGTKPPEGQVPTSRKNDVQYGKLGEESTEQVKESFDMITNSPKYQEEIHRDAPLTTEQGTEKFDDTPANRALRDKIAMREHKKKLAAEKKKKLKKSISEINTMTDGMKELMKDDKDDKDFAIRERNYEALGAGGGKPDNSLLLDVDKPAVKKIKSDAEEILFKAISLKLDLMNKKDDWDKNDKKRTEINEGIKQDTNQGNYGEHELVDLLSEMMGKKTGNVDGSRRAVQAALSGKKGKVGNTTVSMVGGEAPFGKKKIKKLGKSADETIFKAISLKLDLMKDEKTGFTGKKEHGGEMVDYVNGVDADGWTVEDNTKGHKTIMPKGGGFKGMQIYQKHRDETKP